MSARVRTGKALDLHELPQAKDVLDARGLTCGQLEPLIAQRLRALAPGEVLEVLADQPAAEDGIAAWSWLSGNALVAVAPGDSPEARYYVRKKQPQG